MKSAYAQLLIGLAFSILLVYLVIVVNFQSWLDPFIIITALPGALTGIVWSLFLTDTTLSVPALTGAIMCMGTATANSILVVSFARDELAAHGDAVRAARDSRVRTPAAGADDGARHDHRHAADVDVQHAERAARARGHRRAAGGNLCNLDCSCPASSPCCIRSAPTQEKLHEATYHGDVQEADPLPRHIRAQSCSERCTRQRFDSTGVQVASAW